MAFKSIDEAIASEAERQAGALLSAAARAADTAALEVLEKAGLPEYRSIRREALSRAASSVHVDAGIDGKKVLIDIVRDGLIQKIMRRADVD
jgi:hypothetical protein